MALADYTKALKLGQKNYRSLVSHGRYGYLSVLDEILSDSTIIKGESTIGTIEIPIERIVGTKTAGRRNAFAANFMPLLDSLSEFASKWSHLCDALQEEGLRDPIIAYEYMNYYYVLEGNKRVSVMKYLGSSTIPGKVIRMVPYPTEDRENIIYYEYMKFFEKSSINYIYFSKEGRFNELLEEIHIDKEHYWTDEEREDFRSVYINFSKVLGEKISTDEFTIGDALLSYLSIYGYEAVKEQSLTDMQKELSLAWKEISVVAKADNIKLHMSLPDQKTSLLNRLIPEIRKMRVAFIYDKTPKTSSWTYNHELGRYYVEQVFGGQVETLSYEMVSDDITLINALDDAASMGCQMIFITTPKIMDASLKFALEHPEIKILNCALNTSHSIIRTYYGRSYESKFLLGVIAGSLCKSNHIGYIADYPIYGMTANINAFALGARLVNPDATIHLRWSTLKDSKCSAVEELQSMDVHYINGPDLITP
ncbi:Bmp family protein [Lachnospiraceae bacterium TWA4]|nr:Bmp family protein [Lachnospiraceae bacterium TWA4]